MRKTKEYLERLGVKVKLFDPSTDRIPDFDIVHVFMPSAFPSEALRLVNYAKEKGVKTVVSPIFWDFFEFNMKSAPHYKKLLYVPYHMFRSFIYKYSFDLGLRTHDGYVSKVFKCSDLLLPNSRLEANLIVNLFNIDKRNMNVVPNGVDQSFAEASPELFAEKYGISDFILFVGRMDPRKNLLRLLQAFMEADLDTYLVLIGTHAREISDWKCSWQIKRGSRSNIMHLGWLPHESELLRSAYAASKVFALPSWLETPGLAALEAAVAGANIVITSKGCTKEYFDKYAWYVDPANVESIKTALIKAYHSNRKPELRERILLKYTWNRVATETLKAYTKVLNKTQ